MHYSELTDAQKRCVDEFIKYRPELATATSITRPEIEEIWKVLLDRRKSGGVVFGYPMWLVKGPKVSRGVYVFPAPANDNVPTVKPEEINDPAMKELLADCERYGIKV